MPRGKRNAVAVAASSPGQGSPVLGMLEQLARSGVNDLAEIDAVVAAKETARNELVRKLDGELAGLKKIARIVREFVHGKQPRRPRQKRARAAEEAPEDPPAGDEPAAALAPARKRMGRPPKVRSEEPAAAAGLESSDDVIGAAVDGLGHAEGQSLLADLRAYLMQAVAPVKPATIAADLRQKLVIVKGTLTRHRTIFRETPHGWLLRTPAGENEDEA